MKLSTGCHLILSDDHSQNLQEDIFNGDYIFVDIIFIIQEKGVIVARYMCALQE